jgi:restriction endonuclease
MAARNRGAQSARAAVTDWRASSREEPVVARGPGAVMAALAQIRAGRDVESASSGLTWSEFEEFCAEALAAAGYTVTRNVQLRKPRRQLDLFAESSTMGLSIDCKHWRRGVGLTTLGRLARAQVERTRQYKTRLDATKKGILPMLLTMVDNGTRVVDGVPVVPLFALKDFLATVNGFDEELLFV